MQRSIFLVSPNTTNKQISIVILVVVYYRYSSNFVFKKSSETTAFSSIYEKNQTPNMWAR